MEMGGSVVEVKVVDGYLEKEAKKEVEDLMEVV